MSRILECDCGKKVKVNKYVCDKKYTCHKCRNKKENK